MTAWPAKLLRWFAQNRRPMPWRDDPSVYRVWVSEVMLQQTRVDTVVPYFRRFIRRFPSVRALARAEIHDVLMLWEGLGYYSRARNLHRAAREVVSDHGGRVPRSFGELLQLPGLGRYTAAAVASIAFDEPIPAVDGNVLRVGARLWGIADDIRDEKVKRDMFSRLEPILRKTTPSLFNQAIMELGAMVCTPRNPDCPSCPLRGDCVAHAEQRTAELPVKSKKKPVPHQRIAVGVVWKKGRVLIARRREDQMLGGLWEFPGGKCEDGETEATAAAREIKEETGLTVKVGEPYCTVKHAYSHFAITLTAFRCTAPRGRLRAAAADELKWVTPAELRDYPFPAANRRVTKAVCAEG